MRLYWVLLSKHRLTTLLCYVRINRRWSHLYNQVVVHNSEVQGCCDIASLCTCVDSLSVAHITTIAIIERVSVNSVVASESLFSVSDDWVIRQHYDRQIRYVTLNVFRGKRHKFCTYVMTGVRRCRRRRLFVTKWGSRISREPFELESQRFTISMPTCRKSALDMTSLATFCNTLLFHSLTRATPRVFAVRRSSVFYCGNRQYIRVDGLKRGMVETKISQWIKKEWRVNGNS